MKPSLICWVFLIIIIGYPLAQAQTCTGNTFYLPSLNSTPTANFCQTVPVNAAPTSSGIAWQCLDGTVGTYGMRKYNLPCSAYTFSSTLTSMSSCGQYASSVLAEGYTNYGWCVSCQTPGNCPGAWAQVDLGLEGNVAGLMVAGRNYMCNYPLTILVQYSLDAVSWTYVDNGYVFSTGLTSDTGCSTNSFTYNIQRPLSIIPFSQPIIARYLKVYPLAHTGTNNNLYSCMTFEPLAVSEAPTRLLLMFPFTNNYTQNLGWLGPQFNLHGPGVWTPAFNNVAGLLVAPGQVMTLNTPVDFSQISEFTLTYWMTVKSYSCTQSQVAFGLLDDLGNWFYSVSPCYGTSFMKVAVGGTNTVNGFGWGQNVYNMQVFHGRRSGNTNYFWVGQPPGTVYASNGMSTYYEFFNLPRWPQKVQLSIGSPNHQHIITMNDVRLYRDLSVTGYIPKLTGQILFDSQPATSFLPSFNYCAVCQPGFYCHGNQLYACPPNSSAGYQATSLQQCICTPGLFKDPVVGCRACRAGYYCPNQNTETLCSGGCTGFTYQSSPCTFIRHSCCLCMPCQFLQ